MRAEAKGGAVRPLDLARRPRDDATARGRAAPGHSREAPHRTRVALAETLLKTSTYRGARTSHDRRSYAEPWRAWPCAATESASVTSASSCASAPGERRFANRPWSP